MRYPAITPSRSKGYVPNFANDRQKFTPPKRMAFPANNNRPPVSNPAPTPAKQAANYQRAAEHLAGKIAGKAAAKAAAKAALNLHPVGRAARMLWDLYEFADQMGWLKPGQEAQPAGYPGFTLVAQCPSGGGGHRRTWAALNLNATMAKNTNACLSGQAFTDMEESSVAVPAGHNHILVATKYPVLTSFRYKLGAYYYRPDAPTSPVHWSPGQPAKNPEFIPATQPGPRSTPVVRYGGSPQRRPGISVGRSYRPNNLGTVELSVTGRRVNLRLNGDNRPPHGARETKSRAKSWGAMWGIYKIADASTEAVDFLEVLAKATGYEGEDGAENAMAMARHVASNLHNFDPVIFIREYLLNELEDQVIGRISGRMDRVFRKAGIRNPEFGWAM